MKGGVDDPETEALTMESSPPATQKVRTRATRLIERRLDELDACLAKALASEPRCSDVDGRLRRRTDFLRSLIAAERESHKGGALPGHLVDVEWRFGVLERTIGAWAQSGVAAPTEEEEEEEEPAEAAAGSATESGSGGCSCTGSCSGFEEVTGKEAALDTKCNLDQADAEAHKDKEAAAAVPVAATAEAPVATAAAIPVAPATRTSARRRWWKRLAAFCGAAVVVAVVALGAGVALEFAALSQQSVYVVPT